jgi:lysophospholipid acyltransferase (LPLAT)-like uncharacterized protein
MTASQAGPTRKFLMRRVAPSMATLLIRLLDLTWRYRETGRDNFDNARATGRPIVGAFLHGRISPVLRYMGRPKNGRWLSMCSKSLDGDAMAQVEKNLGYEVVRGSSGRDGLQAAVDIIRRMRANSDLYACLAVDGSRGPRGRVQGGIVALAQRTGGVILPIASSASPSFTIKRAWDRTILPLPFARIDIVYGEPIDPAPRLRGRELEALTSRIEASLIELHVQADRQSGFSDTEPLQAPPVSPSSEAP